MKYKTFRALVLGGLGAAAVATGYALNRPKAPEPAASSPSRPDDAPARGAQPVRSLSGDAVAGAADVRQLVLARLGRPAAGTDKIKDALGQGHPKVNLYAEGGRWARAKVDLDRDDRWDEKWWLDGTHVMRAVAPDDDERYTVQTQEQPEGAAAPQGSPTSAEPLGDSSGLRDVDRDLLALLTRPARDKIKDATRGKPYKINLYSDDGSRWSRAKIDLDRDDKWDETISIAGDVVTRKVSPSDDEQYTQSFVLEGRSRWAPRAEQR